MTSNLVKKKSFIYFIVLAISTLLSGCMSAHNIRQAAPVLSIARPIIIMTYNIRIGAGRSDFSRNLYKLKNEKTFSLQPVIAAIRSVNPDIIGLQEVLGERQAAQLGRALNMNYAYAPYGMDKFASWWGTAILSKFLIQDVSIQHMNNFPTARANSNLIANINIYGHKTVFVTMHKSPYLKDGYSFREVMKQVATVHEPVILLGDLNILPGDPRHNILSGHFKDTAFVHTQSAELARKQGTYMGEHGNRRGTRIDYIMVDKNHFEVLDAGLTAEKYWPASDHAGYYTLVTFKQQGP